MNEKRSARLPTVFTLCLLLWMTVYLLAFSENATKATVSGLHMAYRRVVPSVFPYFVLSGIFVSCGLAQRIGLRLGAFAPRLFGLPPCCAGVILLGIVCGFPVGARMASSLAKRGDITCEQAARLAAFTNFCGPSYLISVLGDGVLGSRWYGIFVFGLQTLLSLGAGLWLGRGNQETGKATSASVGVGFSEAFTEAVIGAARSTLHICGYITVFSVFMSSLSPIMQNIPSMPQALIYGFFEMSGGIDRLRTGEDLLLAAVLIALWSGVSVLMQVICALRQDGLRISVLPYLAVRAVILPLGGIMTLVIGRIFHFA